MSKQSGGLSAEYYELPKGATELQHLIMTKNMNAQLGEIFRACYRYGEVSHSPPKRDIKKIISYALFEYERLLLGGASMDTCNAELTRHRESILGALKDMEQLTTRTATKTASSTMGATLNGLTNVLNSLCDESAARGRAAAHPRGATKTAVPAPPTVGSILTDLQDEVDSLRADAVARGRLGSADPEDMRNLRRAKPNFSDVFYSARMCDKGVK